VILPVGVKSIGYDAFADCSRLTRIAIPGATSELEDEDIFSGCESLAEISFGGNEDEWSLLTRGSGIRVAHSDLTIHTPRVIILDLKNKEG
jgi:hypothetical protein